MATTVISAKYPPHIDVTRAPLAYGDRAIPRMNRELRSDDLITRQRAVRSLCDYLKDPEHISQAIEAGVIETLKHLLDDEDLTVRQKATKCLYVIAQSSVGRDSWITFDVVSEVARLFDDPQDIARLNAHEAIEMMSELPQGADAIVTAELVGKLVCKLLTEANQLKEFILDTLHFCMRCDPAPALAADALEAFAALLADENKVIRARAARNIMDISVPLDGKNKAVEVNCMPQLVQLLTDPEAQVRANAAGAIGMITITTAGKYAAFEANSLDHLIPLVDDPSSEIRLNALKAITCISEAPEARRHMLGFVETIDDKINDPLPAVVKAATRAKEVITWTP